MNPPLLYGPTGAPIHNTLRLAMTRREVQLFAEIEPVLRRLGLSLYCMRCKALGMKDGVQAGNDQTAREQRITCGCSERIYIRP